MQTTLKPYNKALKLIKSTIYIYEDTNNKKISFNKTFKYFES